MKYLDAEAGKHENGKEEDEDAEEQLLPAEQHIVDDPPHLWDEADGPQRPQSTDAEEDEEVGRKVRESEGLAGRGTTHRGVEDENGRRREDNRPVHHVPHTADGRVRVQEESVRQYLNTEKKDTLHFLQHTASKIHPHTKNNVLQLSSGHIMVCFKMPIILWEKLDSKSELHEEIFHCLLFHL